MHLLYLARHGETDWNLAGRWQGATDVPLNARGREQASDLAVRLRHHPIGAVASSDLVRARMTAEVVAELLGLPFVGAFAELRERGYGAFEGLTRTECQERHPEVFAALAPGALLEPPGAEPRDEVAARMSTSLDALTRRHGHRERALLVVSHGGAIRTFLHHTTGKMVPPVPNVGVFVVPHDGERFGAPSLLEEDEEIS
jgi:probable phosphoglycerate mutase